MSRPQKAAKKQEEPPKTIASREIGYLQRGEYRMIPVDRIEASPNNPRKHFDQESLAELAGDIAANGLIQPIAVHPKGPHRYEILAGERRYRAHVMLGRAEIAAIVHGPIADLEAERLRLVENLLREDLTVVEEAEALARLRTHGMTPDDIAGMIGKSKRHVYARLQLVGLGKDAREAVTKGEIEPSVAALVARIPDPKVQAKFLAEVKAPDYAGRPMIYKRAEELLTGTYQTSLSKALFSLTDAKLRPEAGACKACPKNSSNAPKELSASANVCTDIGCFERKAKAFGARLAAEYEAAGKPLVSKDDTKRIFRDKYYVNWNTAGYVGVKDTCYGDPAPKTDKHGWTTPRTWQEVIGDALIPSLAIAPLGTPYYGFPKVDAERVLEELRGDESSTPKAETGRRDSERDMLTVQATEHVASEVTTEIAARIVREGTSAHMDRVLRLVVSELIDWYEETVAYLVAPRVEKDLEDLEDADFTWFQEQHVPQLDTKQLLALAVEFIARSHGPSLWQPDFSESFVDIAEAFGIANAELERRRRERITELKKATKALAKTAKTAKGGSR